jgi:hypothetical protein
MDIYQLFARERGNARLILDVLTLLPAPAPDENQALIGLLREALVLHGRASNPVYSALLHGGANPATILSAIESHTVSTQYLCEIERRDAAAAGWLEAAALLRLLVEEYFEEHAEVCALARECVDPAEALEFAERFERKRAAERPVAYATATAH